MKAINVFETRNKLVEIEDYSDFVDYLINARKAKGYTQEELSKKLGKSRGAIANWEIGKSLPDLPDFVELCKTLDFTPNDILGFTPSLIVKGMPLDNPLYEERLKNEPNK